MHSPEGPMLKYCISIFEGAKRFRRQRELELKKTSFESIDGSVQGWSVNSELFVSSDGDGDSDEDFASRLKELENGTKLRRKSTLVSSFGFKRQS